MVECSIKRDDAGFNKLNPKYYLKLHKDNKVILMCEAVMTSTTRHFKIIIKSRRATVAAKNDTFLGKLRADNSNLKWYMFDDGLNEGDYTKNPKELQRLIANGKKLRNQYGAAMF